MIRTYIIPCVLRKSAADALNRASGQVYTSVLVRHYRVYRQTNHWLSQFAAQKLDDYLRHDQPRLLHSYSIDGAQQAFYKACKTAQANTPSGAKYPYKRKRFRTTVWYNSAIRVRDGKLLLSRARGLEPIVLRLPDDLRDVRRILEVRLVYDPKAQRYGWHLVVENGKPPKGAPGKHVVAVDLGEVHPAVVGDENEATIISARARRHAQQGFSKRLAKLQSAHARQRKGSRQWRKLQRAKARLRAKHQRVMRDLEHKISRAVVDVAVKRKAGLIVIGDVREVANGVDLGRQTNQKISQWAHGRVRQYIRYKAEAEGMRVELVDESFTTQTCPAVLADGTHCGQRHKPTGRVYQCPACGFRCHRDVVGQTNLLSRYQHGEPGRIPPPTLIKHRIPHNLRVMRRCRDTGHLPQASVACGQLQEAAPRSKRQQSVS